MRAPPAAESRRFTTGHRAPTWLDCSSPSLTFLGRSALFTAISYLNVVRDGFMSWFMISNPHPVPSAMTAHAAITASGSVENGSVRTFWSSLRSYL